MGAELNRLIAMGGTQNKSPINRYMEARNQVNQEKQNKLAMESTRQNMAMQQQQNQRAQQAQQMKMAKEWSAKIAPVLREVNSKPETERQLYWDTKVPNIMQMAKEAGIPLNENDVRTWNQDKANNILASNPIEAPKRSTKLVGSETVTEDWDSGEGKYKEVGRGIRSTKTGTPEEWKASKSGRNKIIQEQTDARVRLEKQLRGYDFVESLISDPQFVGGATGKAVSMVNSATQQYLQASGKPAVVKDGRVNLRQIDKDSTIFQRLRKSSGLADKEEMATVELAYILAKDNDKGGRVTDKDYQAAERMMGSTADVKTRLEILDYRRSESIDSYNDRENELSIRHKGYEKRLYEKQKKKTDKKEVNVKDQSDEDLFKVLLE